MHIISSTEDFIAKPKIITDTPEDLAPIDYVLCCTKTFNLKDALLSLKSIINNNTVILPLANGLDSYDMIKSIYPENTVWQGCAYIVARRTSPGVITEFAGSAKLYFGSDKENERNLRQLESILIHSGINAQYALNIDTILWEKFLFISPVASLTSYLDKTIGQFRSDENQMNTLFDLVEELKALAQLKKIKISEEINTAIRDRIFFLPYDATSSMHTDFKKGGQTEIESLTGYVVNLAQSLNCETPVYIKMYEYLKTK